MFVFSRSRSRRLMLGGAGKKIYLAGQKPSAASSSAPLLPNLLHRALAARAHPKLLRWPAAKSISSVTRPRPMRNAPGENAH